MTVTQQPIRVFIVEEQLLFARALAESLSRDPELFITAVVRRRTEVQPGEQSADVAILDLDNDPEDPESAVTAIKTSKLAQRVCIVSTAAFPEFAERCMGAGADGYVVKDASLTEFAAAIKCISGGSAYLDARVATALLRRRSGSQMPYTNQLSPRETDIIRLIAQGLSNRDIGQRLVLSEKTVKNHVSRIFSKLHFTARSQAAVHAIRNGLA